jgi:hypothetical protein
MVKHAADFLERMLLHLNLAVLQAESVYPLSQVPFILEERAYWIQLEKAIDGLKCSTVLLRECKIKCIIFFELTHLILHSQGTRAYN